MISKFSVIATFGLLLVPASSRALADSLVVTNFSFETPALGDGNFQSGAPGWTAFGSAGVYDPPAVQYPVVSDGVQIGFTFNAPGEGFQQDLLASLNPGGLNLLQPGSYTLTVAVGNRPAQVMGGYSIALMTVNNDILASATGMAESFPNGFTDVVIPFYASPSDPNLGEQLRIRLLDTGGGQTDFDNVRLTFVPEPSAMMLLGVGGLLLFRQRRTSRG
jgi:hypothetical protein